MINLIYSMQSADAHVKLHAQKQMKKLGITYKLAAPWLALDWVEAGLDDAGLQEHMLEHGLLVRKDPMPTEPCGDRCVCAEYYGTDADDKFDPTDEIECYTRAELLMKYAAEAKP